MTDLSLRPNLRKSLTAYAGSAGLVLVLAALLTIAGAAWAERPLTINGRVIDAEDPTQVESLSPAERRVLKRLIELGDRPFQDLRRAEAEADRERRAEALDIGRAAGRSRNYERLIVNTLGGLLLAFFLVMFILSLRQALRERRNKRNQRR